MTKCLSSKRVKQQDACIRHKFRKDAQNRLLCRNKTYLAHHELERAIAIVITVIMIMILIMIMIITIIIIVKFRKALRSLPGIAGTRACPDAFHPAPQTEWATALAQTASPATTLPDHANQSSGLLAHMTSTRTGVMCYSTKRIVKPLQWSQQRLATTCQQYQSMLWPTALELYQSSL